MKAIGPQSGYVVGESEDGVIAWHAIDPAGPDAEVQDGVLTYKTRCGHHFSSVRHDAALAGLPLCTICAP